IAGGGERESRCEDHAALLKCQPPGPEAGRPARTIYSWPFASATTPMGLGAAPALPLPETRLLPNENGVPVMPVALNAISLFDSRAIPLAWIPTAVKLLTLSFTLISEPGSASMPDPRFPLNTERLIMALLAFATTTPCAFRLEWLLSMVALTADPIAGNTWIPMLPLLRTVVFLITSKPLE